MSAPVVRSTPAMRASATTASAVRRTLMSKTTPSEVMTSVVPPVTVPAYDDVSAIVRAVITVVGPVVTGVNIGAWIGGAATKEQANRRTYAQQDRSGHAP